jgi:ribosome maturation factor RimP
VAEPTQETDEIVARARPLAQARGLDLVDVQVKGAPGRRLVRVMVDRKGGVELDSCTALSRELSAQLDADDPVEGAYALEVTSPGVDHPLAGRAAFDRVEGRTVLVQRGTAADAATQVRGTVVAAQDDAVVLDVDGAVVQVRYDEIVTATQVLPW